MKEQNNNKKGDVPTTSTYIQFITMLEKFNKSLKRDRKKVKPYILKGGKEAYV